MVCFPDHFRYKHADAQFIAERAKLAKVEAVLTTTKDAVKLRNFWSSDVPLFSLQVKLRWLWGEESLWEIVEGCVKNYQAKFEVKP
jgi:Tetraacyldisaccharide-1-P 4''-kinase